MKGIMQQYPQVFEQPSTHILTVSPERTFWKRRPFCTGRPSAEAADCITVLRDDYEHMINMLFIERPEFEGIMDCMERLEQEINKR